MINNKYNKENLEKIVSIATNKKEAINLLGIKNHGGSYKQLNYYIEKYNLDISHFVIKYVPINKSKISNFDFFKENTRPSSGKAYIKRLLELGFEYKCSICSIIDWNNKSLSLHVDHINGINTDNRLENLRILCPNCHQQTSTWGRRKGTYHKQVILKIKKSRPTKISWPKKEELLEMLENSNYSQVGKILGVAGTSVKRHLSKDIE